MQASLVISPLHLIPKLAQLQVGNLKTPYIAILIINTIRGPVFTMKELAFHMIYTYALHH